MFKPKQNHAKAALQSSSMPRNNEKDYVSSFIAMICMTVD